MYGSLEEGTLCRSPVYGRFSFGLSVACTYADARFVGSSWSESGFRPSFPSVTFPNHYSMATGLHPDHHGLVNNFFYAPDLDSVYVMGNPNPAFFGGEPIWNTAEKQGVRTASFYWVGSEYPIQGRQPSIWKPFDKNVPFSDRADSVIAWLQLLRKFARI